MSERSKILGEALRNELKEVLREVIREELGNANGNGGEKDADGLMDVTQASEYLSVTPSWLYKNASSLPFSKKIGGARRFDKCGMRRWVESRGR